jgi:hypothetical protein
VSVWKERKRETARERQRERDREREGERDRGCRYQKETWRGRKEPSTAVSHVKWSQYRCSKLPHTHTHTRAGITGEGGHTHTGGHYWRRRTHARVLLVMQLHTHTVTHAITRDGAGWPLGSRAEESTGRAPCGTCQFSGFLFLKKIC